MILENDSGDIGDLLQQSGFAGVKVDRNKSLLVPERTH
jgi:hypothetical protein